MGGRSSRRVPGIRAWRPARLRNVKDGNGGEIGIRTLDRLPPILDFESSAFDHSAISPASPYIISRTNGRGQVGTGERPRSWSCSLRRAKKRDPLGLRSTPFATGRRLFFRGCRRFRRDRRCCRCHRLVEAEERSCPWLSCSRNIARQRDLRPGLVVALPCRPQRRALASSATAFCASVNGGAGGIFGHREKPNVATTKAAPKYRADRLHRCSSSSKNSSLPLICCPATSSTAGVIARRSRRQPVPSPT